MLREFAQTFGRTPLPNSPTLPDQQALNARITLISEEFDEVVEALEQGRDLVHIASELADLLVVVYGTADVLGIRLDPILEKIHRANMRKFWTSREVAEQGDPFNQNFDLRPNGMYIVRRALDGKILKPPSFRSARGMVEGEIEWQQQLGEVEAFGDPSLN